VAQRGGADAAAQVRAAAKLFPADGGVGAAASAVLRLLEGPPAGGDDAATPMRA
jgi:hypothetical protein